MNESAGIPNQIPSDRPNPARIYDYWLGGYHNFEIDRVQAERILQIYSDFKSAAKCNRAFLRRAVHLMLAQGVEQFLDLGSGIPTVGNSHEVAQGVNPGARIVYVDNDPIAVAHSQAILQGNANAAAIQADIRQPDFVLDHADVKRLIDWRKPAAILALTVLHYVFDEQEVCRIVRTLRDRLVPGSHIAITHYTYDGAPADAIRQMEIVYQGRTGRQTMPRERAQIIPFFDGFELVEPGLVYTPLWRPEGPDDLLLDHPEMSSAWAGVGRKS